jgi:hypothetical protein
MGHPQQLNGFGCHVSEQIWQSNTAPIWMVVTGFAEELAGCDKFVVIQTGFQTLMHWFSCRFATSF